MTYEDLLRQLRERQALIVHFSHHANMRDGGVFPADLHAAALNNRTWALSSCLVWPSHHMSLPGSVGLILHPRSLASIIGIRSVDAGYSTDKYGHEQGAGDNLSQDSLIHSFDVSRGDYNEWRVRDFDVVGIYWEAENGHIYAKKHADLKHPDTGETIAQEIVMQKISVSDVHNSFPELPVFTRNGDKVVASNANGSVLDPWRMNSSDTP